MNKIIACVFFVLVVSFGVDSKEKKVRRRGILFGNDHYNQYQVVPVPNQYNVGEVPLQQTNNQYNGQNQFYPVSLEGTQQKPEQYQYYDGTTYQRPIDSYSQYHETTTNTPTTSTTIPHIPTTEPQNAVVPSSANLQQRPDNIYYIISNPNSLQTSGIASSKYFYAVPVNVPTQTTTTEVPLSSTTTKKQEEADLTLTPIQHDDGNKRVSRYTAMRLLQNAVCNNGFDGYKKK